MATIRPEAMRAHVEFLADDLLEGRGNGTEGYEIAARYVAAQFAQLGLEPAGDGETYLQAVPMRAARLAVLVDPAHPGEFTLADDALPRNTLRVRGRIE